MHQCHSKGISDFVFLGSCSLLATGRYFLYLGFIFSTLAQFALKKLLYFCLMIAFGGFNVFVLAGHSSESKNVCIWDSILPHGKSLVVAFTCHDQGASSLVFAPQHQVLISAGKKGDVCLIDVRTRVIRHRFQAHESAVKCVAIDPHEDYFTTGSADGDIKVCDYIVYSCFFNLFKFKVGKQFM